MGSPSDEYHEFQGREDRWCLVCNRPDMDPAHKLPDHMNPAHPSFAVGAEALHDDDTPIRDGEGRVIGHGRVVYAGHCAVEGCTNEALAFCDEHRPDA